MITIARMAIWEPMPDDDRDREFGAAAEVRTVQPPTIRPTLRPAMVRRSHSSMTRPQRMLQGSRTSSAQRRPAGTTFPSPAPSAKRCTRSFDTKRVGRALRFCLSAARPVKEYADTLAFAQALAILLDTVEEAIGAGAREVAAAEANQLPEGVFWKNPHCVFPLGAAA
ncbi:hypothetical protein HUT06_25520 [Actinomadura sp. NAK00032]|uniref:hypothetical protein n=1 Tax=Actinomadura sp. NAK00032 TaxID=2742128 RepID=UPI0015920734|nr:hypothetical protein [Actinomadura sp. NAK00032]QKW36963.1 hypothetical protein HUT06_25520 [Actinomadura sp. NAK00032]